MIKWSFSWSKSRIQIPRPTSHRKSSFGKYLVPITSSYCKVEVVVMCLNFASVFHQIILKHSHMQKYLNSVMNKVQRTHNRVSDI